MGRSHLPGSAAFGRWRVPSQSERYHVLRPSNIYPANDHGSHVPGNSLFRNLSALSNHRPGRVVDGADRRPDKRGFGHLNDGRGAFELERGVRRHE